MKQESNGELLWKSNLYLLQPGILVYWFSLSILSILVILYQHKNPDSSFLLTALLALKGVAYLIFYYKVIDCMVAILARREKTFFKPSNAFTFRLAIYYSLTLFLISLIGLYLLPPVLRFPLSLFLFFISPAMLIIILLKQQFAEMFKPLNWKAAIEYVGKAKYFAILYMPMLVAIITGIVFGIVFLVISGGQDMPQEEIEFSSLLLQAFISPYFIALQMIYCAFMMRTPNIDAQKLEIFTQKINDIPHRYFTQAEESFARGDYQETVRILERKIHIDNTHLPTYLLLQQALEKINDEKANILLKDIAFLMITLASLNHEDFFLAITPQLTKIAKDDLSQLSPELIYPLMGLAIKHQNYPLALLLGHDFKRRFANNTDAIIEMGFYTAQALDKTNQREKSIALLQTLIDEFPNHQNIARIKRAYHILTE